MSLGSFTAPGAFLQTPFRFLQNVSDWPRMSVHPINIAPMNEASKVFPVAETELRQWALAEGMAVRAEEMLRSALANHIEHGTPLPSAEMHESAKDLRQRADALFRDLRSKV
jgi:hypothetical protein